MVLKSLLLYKKTLKKFFISGLVFVGITGFGYVSADAEDNNYRVKSLSYEEYLEQIKEEELETREQKKENSANESRSTDKLTEGKENIKRNNLEKMPIASSFKKANEGYQVIESEFSSLGEKKTYNIDIDFTDIDTAAIALVKTGKSDVSMTISGSEGEIKNLHTYKGCSRGWYFIDKPSFDATVISYTISVESISYDSEASGFRVMAGDKKDIESMISGIENVVWLEYFTEKKKNQFFTLYTPNKAESWYRFTSSGTDVFTILNCYSD